jgi:LysR substrate binding domain
MQCDEGGTQNDRHAEVLRIGILQSLSSCHVSKLLSSFRRAAPHGAIEVFDGSNEQLIELLEERQLDAVLTILDGGISIFASRALFKDHDLKEFIKFAESHAGRFKNRAQPAVAPRRKTPSVEIQTKHELGDWALIR